MGGRVGKTTKDAPVRPWRKKARKGMWGTAGLTTNYTNGTNGGEKSRENYERRACPPVEEKSAKRDERGEGKSRFNYELHEWNEWGGKNLEKGEGNGRIHHRGAQRFTEGSG